MRGCWGPFEDSEGLASHFDGGANRLAGTKRTKRLRVDLLTSCAKVLREATGFKPQFLVGLGQGGLVTAVLRWELTLQARNLQRKEARAAGEAWAGIKAIWSVRPRLWRTQSDHQEKDFPEPPLRGFGVVGKIAAGDEVLRFLRLDGSKGIEESSIRGMLSEPSREMWDHACGKRTYLFSRCPSCIEQEALDTAVEIAEREDAEVRGSSDRDPESPEVGVEVNGVLAARERAGGVLEVPSSAVQSWAAGFLQAPRDEAVQTLFGSLSPSAEALLLTSLNILRLGWSGRACRPQQLSRGHHQVRSCSELVRGAQLAWPPAFG